MEIKSGHTAPDFVGLGDFVYRSAKVPVFVRAEGALLFDRESRVYLDAEAANGTAGLGYDKTILSEAVSKVSHIPGIPSFCETDLRLRVARRLATLFHESTRTLGRVAFELGGAQGMELAIKVAKKSTGKSRVAVLSGAYHGRSVYTGHLSASTRYRDYLREPSANVVRLPVPGVGESDGSYLSESECLRYIRWLVSSEAGGLVSAGELDICALAIEPVLNVGGMVAPSENFFNELVSLFQNSGALLIVDEIFTGLYRAGPQWGFQRCSLKPDVIVASKGFSNGLVPVSVVWARAPLMDQHHFPPGTHSITYGNNPLSLAVVDTVLDRYEALAPSLGLYTDRLKNAMTEALVNSPFVENAEVIGNIGRIVLKDTSVSQVREWALDSGGGDGIDGVHGLLIAGTGMARHVACLHPPLTMGEGDFSVLSGLLRRTFNGTH